MSNGTMNNLTPTSNSNGSTATTDQRLTDLEIKATYAEDLLEQLDAVIVKQQQQIDLLIREVRTLRELQKNAGTGLRVSAHKALMADLPPHF
jgi:SlyX protein